ncbi:hypothetical protein DFH06DRAFT_691536 [Mycena polygramma]|nr:hypothetical protein DFH06DRAFT_691536 [Mycena polygramma]
MSETTVTSHRRPGFYNNARTPDLSRVSGAESESTVTSNGPPDFYSHSRQTSEVSRIRMDGGDEASQVYQPQPVVQQPAPDFYNYNRAFPVSRTNSPAPRSRPSTPDAKRNLPPRSTAHSRQASQGSKIRPDNSDASQLSQPQPGFYNSDSQTRAFPVGRTNSPAPSQRSRPSTPEPNRNGPPRSRANSPAPSEVLRSTTPQPNRNAPRSRANSASSQKSVVTVNGTSRTRSNSAGASQKSLPSNPRPAVPTLPRSTELGLRTKKSIDSLAQPMLEKF